MSRTVSKENSDGFFIICSGLSPNPIKRSMPLLFKKNCLHAAVLPSSLSKLYSRTAPTIESSLTFMLCHSVIEYAEEG